LDAESEIVTAELVPIDTASAPPTARDAERDAAMAHKVREDLASLMPSSTSRAYRSDITQYQAWCRTEGLPAAPATADQLALYVAYLTLTTRPRTNRPYSPRSIERAIAAIRAAHRAARLAPPDTEAALKYLAAYRKALSVANDPAALPRQAEPARPRQLARMVATLDRTTLRGARDAAVLLLGYAIAGRESEIVSLDLSSVRDTEEGLYVTVYRRKVDIWSENLPIPFAADPALCPVRAFRQLREAMAGRGLTGGPLFVRLDHTGTPAAVLGRPRRDGTADATGRLTPESVATIVARTAHRAGLTGRFTGHSLRRGFVTEARERGVPFERIAAHGGWDPRSRALLAYSDPGLSMAHSPVCL